MITGYVGGVKGTKLAASWCCKKKRRGVNKEGKGEEEAVWRVMMSEDPEATSHHYESWAGRGPSSSSFEASPSLVVPNSLFVWLVADGWC
jgi:hypothetical protein